MASQKKNAPGVGCCGLSIVTIIGIIFFIIRLINASIITSQQNAAATLEASCPNVIGISLDPSTYIGKDICMRGPIKDIQTSPSYIITFGYQNPNTKLGTKVTATSDNYYLTGISTGMCIHIWGHLTQAPDGSLQLIIDTSKSPEVYQGEDC